METGIRRCLTCGTQMERPRGVSRHTWETRSYCSRSCYAAAPRKLRATTAPPESKTCQMCGRDFPRPANQRGEAWRQRQYCSMACVHRARSAKAWEERPQRTCPICKIVFRSSTPAAHRVTCGKPECKTRYAQDVLGPQRSAMMKAAYARGERPKVRGISPREEILWPLLSPHGWEWRHRWFDAAGCFELDFSIWDRKLNVEIDGPEHAQSRRRGLDAVRDAELQRRGWTVVRITNAEVDADPDGVARRILSL
jgi:very-short-patch-repair endonuclease